MTDEGSAARDRKTISIIVLAVVVTILVGAIVGFIASGGLSDEPSSEAAPTTTIPTPVTSGGVTTPPSTSVATTQPTVSEDPPGQLTILASEDTYTDASDPAEVNGFDVIEIETDPPEVKQGLVRFDVAGLPEGVVIEQVSLRLNTSAPTSAPIAVHLVDGEWNETETSAANAPALGERVGTVGASGGEGEPIEGDLTGAFTGPGPLSLYLVSTTENSTEIFSRENGANGPALILRWTP